MIGKTNVAGMPGQEKTVTAGTSATTVTPDAGKVLNKVTVNPTPSQSKTVSPSTSEQTVSPDSGYLLGSVKVSAMTGVTQATPSITVDVNGLITASADQEAGYVAAGTKSATKQLTTQAGETVTPGTAEQTVVAAGTYVIGDVKMAAMPSGALSDISVSSSGLITGQVGTSGYLASGTKKTKQLTTQAAKTVTPGTSEQIVVAAGVYTTGAIKVAGITPEQGVELMTMFGCTKIAVDTFTMSNDVYLSNGKNYPIPHSLGEIPKLTLAMTDFYELLDMSYERYAVPFLSMFSDTYQEGSTSGGTGNQLFFYTMGATESVRGVAASSNSYSGISEDYITANSVAFYKSSGDYHFPAGVPYTLITMA